jgi:RNA polymerase sigma-70 factor (ECF subfamily)
MLCASPTHDVSESLTPTTEPPAVADDAELIRGLRAGERSAWTALYDQYSGRIWRYAARLVGSDSAPVSDIVQETFLAAARGARQFDPARGTLWAWLAGIAHNFVATHWRHSARQSRIVAESPGRVRSADDVDDPQRGLEQQEDAAFIRLVLSKLPADYALILVARYIDDISPDELPSECGGTPEAVRSRLTRARKEFKATYERLQAGRQ